MIINFKSIIAFELQYNSEQINEIYRSFNILNKPPQILPLFIVQQCIFTPKDLQNYLKKLQNSTDASINILFETHHYTLHNEHNDWDLITD